MNETYDEMYVTAQDESRNLTFSAENKHKDTENTQVFPLESQWLQKTFQCSGCQTLVPHNNLFMCSKPNCQFAMNSSRTIDTPGELYSAESVFCGQCSFRGLHSAHQAHMVNAEPLAIEKASQSTGCKLQRQFDSLSVFDTIDIIESAIADQRKKELKGKPKVRIIDYLKNATDCLEWTQRMHKIQDFVKKIQEKRQKGRDHLNRLIKKEMHSFNVIEEEIMYDVITKRKAVEEAERKKYADHAMSMSTEHEQKDFQKVEKSTSSSMTSYKYSESEKSQSIQSYVSDQAKLLETLDNEVGGFGCDSTPTKRPRSPGYYHNDEMKTCPSASEHQNHNPYLEPMYDLNKLSELQIEYTTPEEQNIQNVLYKSFKADSWEHRSYHSMPANGPSTSQKTREELQWEKDQKASKEAIRLLQDEYLEREKAEKEKGPSKFPASFRRPVIFRADPEKKKTLKSEGCIFRTLQNSPTDDDVTPKKHVPKFGEDSEPVDDGPVTVPARRGPSDWFLKSTGQWDAYQEKQKAYQNRQNWYNNNNSYKYKYNQGRWNNGGYGNYQNQNQYQGQNQNQVQNQSTPEFQQSQESTDKKWDVNCREIHGEWNSSRHTEHEFHKVTAKSKGYGLMRFLESPAGNQFSGAFQSVQNPVAPTNSYPDQRPLCPPPSSTDNSEIDEQHQQEEEEDDDSDDTFSEATQKFVPTENQKEVVDDWRHPAEALAESTSVTDLSCTLLTNHFEYIRDNEDLEYSLIKIAHKLDGMENLTAEAKGKVADLFRERTSFRIYWPIPKPESDDN